MKWLGEPDNIRRNRIKKYIDLFSDLSDERDGL
jgi:hypothetical protein